MRFLKLTIAYDGTAYCGWQVQANAVSIQQQLERSWKRVTGEVVRITASGRTDAGVHAEGQVCSLGTLSRMLLPDLMKAPNAETPFDVSVVAIEEADAGFHAIRDAIGKTYRYQIQFGRIRDPLKIRYWWQFTRELNIAAMRSGAEFLIGTHDFASFQSAGAERNSTIRTIDRLELLLHDPRSERKQIDARQPHEPKGHFPTLIITISANGFLYKMVRNIVGSLVRVGEGKENSDWIRTVLEQRNRNVAGQAAPAHGLYLQEVIYKSSSPFEVNSNDLQHDLRPPGDLDQA